MHDTHFFRSIGGKILLSVVMACAADWIFYAQYNGWFGFTGLGVGIYALVLLTVVLLLNRKSLKSVPARAVVAANAVLGLSLINSPSILSITLYALLLATILIFAKRERVTDAVLWVKDVAISVTGILSQWYRDHIKIGKLRQKKALKINLSLRYAALPALLTISFCFLFAKANPVISDILDEIDFQFFGQLLSPARWAGWLLITITIWGILRPKFSLAVNSIAPPKEINLDYWLNRNSIIVSLVVFNALFAVQNILDISFLWSGEPIPNGMTYAEYAHTGAYPLILTTVLAAIYVLITFGENSKKYQSPAAKAWIFAWIAQNIFLVSSSINRNIHYIEAYSLTYLRCAALIWMGLVAVGLMLIIIRIQLDRKNIWLINMNISTLAFTLYICSFINFGGIIADYNVRHAKEVTGESTSTFLDLQYMADIGPEALPALLWFEKNAAYSPEKVKRARLLIGELSSSLGGMNMNWRLWTWRHQLIQENIEGNPADLKTMYIPDIINHKEGWQTE